MEKILICESNIPDIDFDYKKLDKEEIELVVTLSLVTREKETGEELKDKFEEFVKFDPLTNLIYLRYKHFKDELALPEITPLVFSTIAILSGGNPGRCSRSFKFCLYKTFKRPIKKWFRIEKIKIVRR